MISNHAFMHQKNGCKVLQEYKEKHDHDWLIGDHYEETYPCKSCDDFRWCNFSDKLAFSTHKKMRYDALHKDLVNYATERRFTNYAGWIDATKTTELYEEALEQLQILQNVDNLVINSTLPSTVEKLSVKPEILKNGSIGVRYRCKRGYFVGKVSKTVVGGMTYINVIVSRILSTRLYGRDKQWFDDWFTRSVDYIIITDIHNDMRCRVVLLESVMDMYRRSAEELESMELD